MQLSLFQKYFMKPEYSEGGVMVEELDCGIVVSEFELKSLYYVHFRTNTLKGKVLTPLSFHIHVK